jgi:hypothetical protein
VSIIPPNSRILNPILNFFYIRAKGELSEQEKKLEVVNEETKKWAKYIFMRICRTYHHKGRLLLPSEMELKMIEY